MKYFVVLSLMYALSLFVNLELVLMLSSYVITDVTAHPIGHYLWMILIYMAVFFLFKLFTNRMSSSRESLQIIKADLTALVVILSLLVVIKESEAYSRFIVLAFFLSNLLIPLYFMLLKARLFRLPWLRERVIVFGDAPGVAAVRQWLGTEFSGFDIEEVLFEASDDLQAFELQSIGNTQNYYAAAIAADALSVDELFGLTEKLQHRFVRLVVIPNLKKFPLVNARILGSIEHKGIAFSVPNNLLNPLERVLKWLFDLCMTFVIALLALPFVMLIYLAVAMLSRGRPVYRQRRIGHGGKPFFIYKFTSMRPNADAVLEALLKEDAELRSEWERDHKLKHDPRITRFGHFLRKTSLDELPQLYNVLRGEMSLVGPRPIVEGEVEKYGDFFHYYTAVKPGITGLWQVSGRNDIDYEERVWLDVWYVRNWSVDLDVMLLLKTFNAVVRKRGSY